VKHSGLFHFIFDSDTINLTRYKVSEYSLKEREYLEDLSVNAKIILKCMLKKQKMREGTGLIRLRTGTNGGLL
jgi:hypothetical protein